MRKYGHFVLCIQGAIRCHLSRQAMAIAVQERQFLVEAKRKRSAAIEIQRVFRSYRQKEPSATSDSSEFVSRHRVLGAAIRAETEKLLDKEDEWLASELARLEVSLEKQHEAAAALAKVEAEFEERIARDAGDTASTQNIQFGKDAYFPQTTFSREASVTGRKYRPLSATLHERRDYSTPPTAKSKTRILQSRKKRPRSSLNRKDHGDFAILHSIIASPPKHAALHRQSDNIAQAFLQAEKQSKNRTTKTGRIHSRRRAHGKEWPSHRTDEEFTMPLPAFSPHPVEDRRNADTSHGIATNTGNVQRSFIVEGPQQRSLRVTSSEWESILQARNEADIVSGRLLRNSNYGHVLPKQLWTGQHDTESPLTGRIKLREDSQHGSGIRQVSSFAISPSRANVMQPPWKQFHTTVGNNLKLSALPQPPTKNKTPRQSQMHTKEATDTSNPYAHVKAELALDLPYSRASTDFTALAQNVPERNLTVSSGQGASDLDLGMKMDRSSPFSSQTPPLNTQSVSRGHKTRVPPLLAMTQDIVNVQGLPTLASLNRSPAHSAKGLRRRPTSGGVWSPYT